MIALVHKPHILFLGPDSDGNDLSGVVHDQIGKALGEKSFIANHRSLSSVKEFEAFEYAKDRKFKAVIISGIDEGNEGHMLELVAVFAVTKMPIYVEKVAYQMLDGYMKSKGFESGAPIHVYLKGKPLTDMMQSLRKDLAHDRFADEGHDLG